MQIKKYFLKTLKLGLVFGLLPYLVLILPVHFTLNKNRPAVVDQDLQPLYSSFLEEGKKRGHDLSSMGLNMHFVEALEGKTLAQCSIVLGFTPDVIVSRVAWRKASPIEREMIIFHELGHCFLLKGHNDHLHNQVPTTLMTTNIFNQNLYYQNREKYLDTLFSYEVADTLDTARMFMTPPIPSWLKFSN